MFRYFIANKPFNMICQFTPDSEGQKTLANLNFDFPKDVYPIGRLDIDSEGLLLLTNDRKLNHTLLNPQFAHERIYLSLVQDIPTEESLNAFRKGLDIKIEKKRHITLPCKCQIVSELTIFFNGNDVWERIPPPMPQAWKPMTWLEVKLIEGKYRQVRRMCAKIEHPCLRLIRVKIANLSLGDLQPNEVLELDREFVYEQLGLKKKTKDLENL
ncbi:MAG: pseudouridine synthase [Saprospiraceae bacterium]|nr:pseudouridine synthase [Saprospiraceae bacterium]